MSWQRGLENTRSIQNPSELASSYSKELYVFIYYSFFIKFFIYIFFFYHIYFFNYFSIIQFWLIFDTFRIEDFCFWRVLAFDYFWSHPVLIENDKIDH